MFIRPSPIAEEVIKELSTKPLDDLTARILLKVIRLEHGEVRPHHDAWTTRDQANALTASAFRNGFLEELHAGKRSPLLDDPSLSRITDAEMRKLMIESSARLASWLRLRAVDNDTYMTTLIQYHHDYCRDWERTASTASAGEKRNN